MFAVFAWMLVNCPELFRNCEQHTRRTSSCTSGMDQCSWARQLHFYPRREPLQHSREGFPQFYAGMRRMHPVDTAPMLDRHQNRMMRTTKTPAPELEVSHGLAESRACLWDTGSRLLAFPGATDDCWAVGGVKTLSRSRSSSSRNELLASPIAPVRPRTSYDQFRTTSMEIGSHYESALLPPSPPHTRSLRVLQSQGCTRMHQAQCLAGGY